MMLPKHTNNLLFSVVRNVDSRRKLVLMKPVVKEMQDAERDGLVFRNAIRYSLAVDFSLRNIHKTNFRISKT